MMAFIKGLAGLLTAVAAILTVLVSIRGDWGKLFAAPTPGAAIAVAVTGSSPKSNSTTTGSDYTPSPLYTARPIYVPHGVYVPAPGGAGMRGTYTVQSRGTHPATIQEQRKEP